MSHEVKKCAKCNELKSIDDYCNITIKRQSGNYIGKKGTCKQCLYLVQKQYRVDNLERLQARDAAYHLTVKDKRRQQEIIRLANPENRQARRDYIREYRKQRRIDDPSFHIYESLRKRIWKSIYNKSDYSIEYLGCDIKFYQKWIEFTMMPDMNWSNYGILWNIDHVVPIANFDASNNEEMKNAFNWKNTCARYSSENFSKKDSINRDHILQQKSLLNLFNRINMKCDNLLLKYDKFLFQTFEMGNPQPSILETI